MKKTAKLLIRMNGKYILDTNIIIRLFAEDVEILQKVDESEEIFVPSIVIGELCYGAFNSKKVKSNISKIEKLTSEVEILDCDYDTGMEYGEIKKELKDKGTPIPDNDIWIAAISRQYNIELVSRDEHFKDVENLKWIKW